MYVIPSRYPYNSLCKNFFFVFSGPPICFFFPFALDFLVKFFSSETKACMSHCMETYDNYINPSPFFPSPHHHHHTHTLILYSKYEKQTELNTLFCFVKCRPNFKKKKKINRKMVVVAFFNRQRHDFSSMLNDNNTRAHEDNQSFANRPSTSVLNCNMIHSSFYCHTAAKTSINQKYGSMTV